MAEEPDQEKLAEAHRLAVEAMLDQRRSFRVAIRLRRFLRDGDGA